MKLIWGAGLIALVTVAAAAGRLTERELDAKFYFDLGPDAVDVSAYPKAMQDSYKVFEATCSRCHTLARPINAPIVKEADWRRFVERMHQKGLLRKEMSFDADAAKQILAFLAYDSKVRKVDHKEDFAARTLSLNERFEQVKNERALLEQEEDAKKVKPYGDDTTPRPHAQ